MRKIYDIWFHKLKLSHYVKKILVSKVSSFEEMYQTKAYKEWGLTDEAIYIIETSKHDLKTYEYIASRCNNLEIEVIGYFDESYPILLREIPDAPMLLYVKGNKKWLSYPMVGVVGARHCSEYGDRMARRLAEELAYAGVVTVSGLAMGIDAGAHEGALKTGLGYTIGVLGTGVDLCYPMCNKRLYERIISEGCLVSEYEPGASAKPYHFPMRNRIISGMSYGVTVVEAAKKSGSLITAQLALDYGRDVYAVPGKYGKSFSEGADALIEGGAKCVESAAHIIEELPREQCIKRDRIKKNSDKMHNQLAQAEGIVYAYVGQEPILLEDLKEVLVSTQLSYERLNTSLIKLEIKGLIKRLPGERYVRI